jgi:phosphatidylserine/phosphatidylglycerophosphate/cardiolipin synthase-like enzyme
MPGDNLGQGAWRMLFLKISSQPFKKKSSVRKSVQTFVVVFSFFVLSIPLKGLATDLTLNNTPTQVYFSPHKGCTEAIIRELEAARSGILVQAYSFTSAPIARALLDAHKRGVRIEAILDKSQRGAKYSSATFLANSGVPTYIDDSHAIAHNKIMIIDRATVITGSFNFTKAAEERNAENILILKSPHLASIYIENWSNHREHSERYQGRY